MRVTTALTIDIASGVVLTHEWFEYAGEFAECKKGREQADKASAGANALGGQASGIATADQGIQSGYRATGDKFANSLMPNPNGTLSPYIAAQFGQEKRQIGKTYADTAAVGERAAAARGFGGGPTGLTASIRNTAGRQAGEDTTRAYEDAQGRTLGAGLEGLRYSQGQQEIYDPNKAIAAGTGAFGTGGDIAAKRRQMGSGLGDVASGIGSFAGGFV